MQADPAPTRLFLARDPYAWIDPADAIFVVSCREALALSRRAWEACHAERMTLLVREGKLKCELETAGLYTEAHERLDAMARESIARAEAAEARLSQAARESLIYDALWELVAALAQHPTLKLRGRLADALEAGRKAALAEHSRRAAEAADAPPA